MSLYLIYVLASVRSSLGLISRGVLNQNTQIYDYHPQLELQESYKNLKRFNHDVLSMMIVRMLQGNLAHRISAETTMLIKRYDNFFI